jgi:[protein-PII] uridylyltransferase
VGQTPSEDLASVRAGVLRRPGLVCADLRAALADAYDGWLGTRFGHPDGAVALAAVGALGRREPAPCSDLDLVLLHDGRAKDVSALADALWYPIWDSGLALDHSVRTPAQAVAVAKQDVKALLGLLDLRPIAGDEELVRQLRERLLEHWRATAQGRFAEVDELSRGRWEVAGDGAFLLEPNLKDSRGGLRDALTLRAFALAQLLDLPQVARQAVGDLLDMRGELHRSAGRADDVLRRQEHDAVAAALGLITQDGEPDRDEVLRRANHAARVLSHAYDRAAHRLRPPSRPRGLRRVLGGSPEVRREGLARDVVAHDREVALARDADPATDPEIVLRAARAAAENDLPLSEFTLRRLAGAPPLSVPWPAEARSDFLGLLGAGPPAVRVLEALDFAGLLEPLIPEWAAVRSKAQHNPVHRFTVDRHLLEAAAEASIRAREVDRPDLLLMGALLHDLGKGFPGDHSVVGAEHARVVVVRMGFDPADVGTITALVRHHLLLPDTATRRDLDDPVTITTVADAVGGSLRLLDTLHVLTVADAAATGPGAWSDWKAGLVRELVARTRAVLSGEELPPPPPLDKERREMAASRTLAVRYRGDEVLVAAPDSVGVLYRTAGVLALHSLDVRSASIATVQGMAVNSFVVQPRFGRLPDPALLRAELARALAGELPLAERLRAKESAYARGERSARPPTVGWFDDAATDATVIEVRAEDSIGLLCRLTAAFHRSGVDVRSARVSSLGGSAVDSFYVTTRDGRPIPREARADIEIELRGV